MFVGKTKQRVLEYFIVIVLTVGYVSHHIYNTNRLIAFNNVVINALTKGDCAYSQMAYALRNWSLCKNVDVQHVRDAIRKFKITQEKFIKQLKDLEQPSDENAKELYKIALSYLKKNCEIADDYNKLANYIELHNPGTPHDLLYSKNITSKNLAISAQILKKFYTQQNKLKEELGFKE